METIDRDLSRMFRDRRSGRDRRQRDSLLHDMGRRHGDRRRISEQFNPRPWWLRVNYVVAESSLRPTGRSRKPKDA